MNNATHILLVVATCAAFAVLVAPAPTGQQMTDAMYAAFGDNHSRAVHAKGTDDVEIERGARVSLDVGVGQVGLHCHRGNGRVGGGEPERRFSL